MGDVDHILDWTPDYTFRSGVGAATGGHYPGDRFLIGANAAVRLTFFINIEVLSAILLGFLRIGLQHLLDQHLFFFCSCYHDVLSVRIRDWALEVGEKSQIGKDEGWKSNLRGMGLDPFAIDRGRLGDLAALIPPLCS